MNWLLFILLLCLGILSFFFNRRCILTPSFVMTGVMMLSALLLALNTDYWDYRISIETLVIILMSVLAFWVGETIALHSKRVIIVGRASYLDDRQLIKLSSWKYYLLIVVSFILFGIFFYFQYINASSVGMAGSISSLVSANRWYVENRVGGEIEKFLFICHRVLVYLMIFYYFYNKICFNLRGKKILTILIALPYFLSCAISSNRSDIISFASFLIFIIIFLNYRKINWESSNNGKLILSLVAIGALALYAFRMLGYLTGKSLLSSTYDNISLYAGSPFLSFDMYISGKAQGFDSNSHPLLFRGIYSIINMFGFNIDAHSFFKPHQHWGRWGANVYSSLLEYHIKFGTLGLLVMEVMIGMFYGCIWKKIKSGVASWPLVIIYGELFFYYIYMYPIDERLFSQFFTLTSFIEVFLIIVFVNKLFDLKKGEDHEL